MKKEMGTRLFVAIVFEKIMIHLTTFTGLISKQSGAMKFAAENSRISQRQEMKTCNTSSAKNAKFI